MGKEVEMTTIKGIVRNGQIQLAAPLRLPEGTELIIPIPDPLEAAHPCAEAWSDSSEAIEAWLRWYDSIEPVDFTEEERAAWDASRQQQKELELAQWERRSRGLEGLFP
jgi:hypothetical protein